MPCAPSPPSTFCQEKVTTSSFAKSRRCAKAAEVASQIVRPAAVGRNEIGIRNAHAGGRAVPGEDHVAVEIDRREIGQPAVVRFDDAGIGELELLDDIGDPAGAEALPGDHVDAARAEQRPQRHLDRAGVGGRHDADPVVGRHLQDVAGELDRLLELGLADLGAVRAAERGSIERCSDHPGRLAQGPEEKLGFAGRNAGFGERRHRGLSFQIAAPRWGGVAHGRRYGLAARGVKRNVCVATGTLVGNRSRRKANGGPWPAIRKIGLKQRLPECVAQADPDLMRGEAGIVALAFRWRRPRSSPGRS